MPSGVVISGTAQDEGVASFLFSRATQTELPEEDRQKAKWVWGNLTKAKQWKLACGFAEAEENWNFWLGKQWIRQRAQSLSMAVLNQVFNNTETFLGHLADDIPDSIARPRRMEHQRVGQTVTKLLNWTDDLNDYRALIELCGRSAIITGFSVLRVDWDVTADGQRGAPRHSFVDEGNFFVSPWTRNPDLSDSEYAIEARNIPISYVRRTWPEHAASIPPGVWDGTLTTLREPGQQASRDPWGSYQAFTTSDGNVTNFTKGQSMVKNKDLATLIEQWFRQDDGTLRYTVCCNGVILEDGPSPYEDEKYPYSIMNVLRNKDSAYGHSMVSFYKKLQMELNEIHSYMLDQQRYESDSPLVVNQVNVEEGQMITNAPGSIYIDSDPNGHGYYLLSKQGANHKWLEMEDMVVKRINDQMGNVDILRGDRPAGVTTLGAMEIIRDEANVLVRKMVQQMLRSVKQKDKLTISRLKQFLKDERTVRVSGSGNTDEFVTVNQRQGMMPNGEWAVENSIPDDFEADIDFSPQPPGGVAAKFERALALIGTPAEDGKPIVDRQWVLEAIEEDQERIDELMERIGAQQQADAQMAAQQAQAQGPAAAGGPVPPMPAPMPQDPAEMIQEAMSILT
jgi:nucleoid DNA-binding protein